MVFSSAVFVFGFMPLLLFLYFLAEPKYRNYILLIFSLIFYGWGGVNYLLLMLAVVMSDYVFAIAIAQIKTQKIRKLFVVLSVVVNLGVLGYYKYTNFFIENINHFIKNDIKIATIVLPIGISVLRYVVCIAFSAACSRSDRPLQNRRKLNCTSTDTYGGCCRRTGTVYTWFCKEDHYCE